MTNSNVVKVLCAHSRVMSESDEVFMPYFVNNAYTNYRIGYNYGNDTKVLFKSSDLLVYTRNASEIVVGFMNNNIVSVDNLFDIASSYFNIKYLQYYNDLSRELERVSNKSNFMLEFEMTNEFTKPIVFKEGFT